MKVSYLILDYNRPKECKALLYSLNQFVRHENQIIYLCNGGESEYAYNYYKEGLIDIIIARKDGYGGGFGQTDLFRYCDTEFSFFIQVDQKLIKPIDERTIESFVNLLQTDYKCVDLNGDQSNRDTWTDRAHFIDVNFFNSLGPFPNGGPGNNHHLKWNEQHLQEKFTQNNYKIAHISPLYFQDCGCWAVRQNPDGSVWKHRTDTKTHFLISGFVREKYIYPNFTDLEWSEVIRTQQWSGIPEKEKPHSFVHWRD